MRNSIIIIIFLFIITELAFGLTHTQVNKAIKKQNANWVAGANNRVFVSGIDLPEGDEDITIEVLENAISKGFPRKLNWHNKGGLNFMSPVTNQGSCGSCVAFAAVATFEGQLNVTNNWPSLNFNFSEQHIWGCGGGRCNRGWQTYQGANFIERNGVPDEACFPYTSGANALDRACSESCANSDSRSIKAKKAITLGGWYTTDNDVIEALQKGPVLGRMSVYADFMKYESGIYSHVEGGMLGGHAITFVGYDLDERYWIVKNSWGSDWGENGYFRIRMGDQSNMKGTNRFDVNAYAGLASITSPKFKEMVKGEYTVKIETTYRTLKKINLLVKKGNFSRTFSTVRVKGPKHYEVKLNTLELSDGVYEINSVANTGKSIYESQIKRLFILNGTPIMDAGIVSPVNGETLSGTSKVILSLRGEPIPVLKAILHVKRPDGTNKQILLQNPALKTIVNLNTKKRPNGNYEFYVESFIGNHSKKSPKVQVIINN